MRGLEAVGVLEILPEEHPLLRTISAPVVEFGRETAFLAAQMLMAMQARNGLGLAAVQVGKPLRLIVAQVEGQTHVMANPTITRRLNRFDVRREGCLSVRPSRWCDVSRPAKCEIHWQGVNGNDFSDGFSGMVARVLQHEIDHLDGILITDAALSLSAVGEGAV